MDDIEKSENIEKEESKLKEENKFDKIKEIIDSIKQIEKTITVWTLECPYCKKKFEYESYNQTVQLFKSHLQTHK